MSEYPTVYVFFMKRKQDNEPWPAIYTNKELAQSAYGRCSPVMEISMPESMTDGRPMVMFLPEEKIEKLQKIGDALAHQLLYKDHAQLLDSWWNERGNDCTVCKVSPHAAAS